MKRDSLDFLLRRKPWNDGGAGGCAVKRTFLFVSASEQDCSLYNVDYIN
ncbi:MAG: hypothetical protein AAFX87_26245 [Bacteroidota bacterium]